MKSMSKIVTATTRLLFGFMLVFGLYVTINGHLSPGGGFQGGVVLGSAFALVFLAFGYERARELTLPAHSPVVAVRGAMLAIYLFLIFLPTLAALNVFGLSGLYEGIRGIFNTVIPSGINSGTLTTGGTLIYKNLAIGVEVFLGVWLIIVYLWRSRNDDFTIDVTGIVPELQGEEGVESFDNH